MKTVILFADLRNLITSSRTSLARHQVYAKVLQEKYGTQYQLGVIRFSKFSSQLVENCGGLVLINLPSNPFKLISIKKSFTEEKFNPESIGVLVAGDPWESFIFAKLISGCLISKPQIQVQVHGDFGNSVWIKARIRNRIRSILATKTLMHASQIRAVSTGQANKLITKYAIQRDRVEIIPVPCFYESIPNPQNVNNRRSRTLGLVGRLQKDRGLSTFIELARKLVLAEVDFSVVVAGSGPEIKSFKRELSSFMPPGKYLFLGEIEQSMMSSVWSQIGVLVSCAPTESYGRAPREALTYGVPVWATPSTGIIDLSQDAKDDSLVMLDVSQPALALAQSFNKLLSSQGANDFGMTQYSKDKQSIEKLIDSWMQLIQSC